MSEHVAHGVSGDGSDLMGAEEALDLARLVAERVDRVPGVVAVVLGGSRALGTAASDSDIDLGIYYRSTAPLSIDELRAVAAGLGGDGQAVTGIGKWGPWINGGAWLEIEGWRVDWIYRDLDRVGGIIERCRTGHTGWHYQPGHPFAFCEHIYMGEVHACIALADRGGAVATLKARTLPYPAALKRTIIGTLWEARFALDAARKGAARGDTVYVAGCLFRCAAILAQALFAINERYWLNEKGAVAAVTSLPFRPPEWETSVQRALGGLRSRPDELLLAVGALEALTRSVEELCGRLDEPHGKLLASPSGGPG